MTDEDLEEIRRRKLEEYQKRLQARQLEEQQREALELQKRAILRKILDPDARTRLANVRLVNPGLAEQVEYTLIALYQSGRLARRVTDAELKKILERLSSRKREPRIEIRRK